MNCVWWHAALVPTILQENVGRLKSEVSSKKTFKTLTKRIMKAKGLVEWFKW
jgi:hypothetical protein